MYPPEEAEPEAFHQSFILQDGKISRFSDAEPFNRRLYDFRRWLDFGREIDFDTIVDNLPNGDFRMPVRIIAIAVAVSSALAMGGLSHACTTILLGAPGHTRLAYSYDFITGAGALLINGRGAQRRSVIVPKPDVWSVRYASVTFNQFGPGLPTTGMNEAGLVVTLMWNEGVEYPAPTTTPSVGELEMIQRMLDTSATVDEAIAEAMSVVVPGMVPIHYFVTDREGERAILAHQDGDLTVRVGNEVPVPALTNVDYDMLLASLTLSNKGIPADGRSDDLNDLSGNSLGRFAAAKSTIDDAGPYPSTSNALDALVEVANEMTQWNVVYAPFEGIVSFRKGTTGPVNSLKLDSVELACRPRPLGVMLGDANTGEIEKILSPFDEAANLNLIRGVYPAFPPTRAFLPPEEHSEFAADTLEATNCVFNER